MPFDHAQDPGREPAAPRAQLRTCTQPVHAWLHANGPFARVLQGRYGAGDLEAIAQARRITFAPLFGSSGHGHARAVFGRSASAVFGPPVTPACGLSGELDRATFLGLAYVLIGASMGGRLLRQRLERSVDADRADALFRDLATPDTWRALQRGLGELEPKGRARATRAALEAFLSHAGFGSAQASG